MKPSLPMTDVHRLHHLVDRWAEFDAALPALRDPGCAFTYGQLREAAASTALHLQEAGLRPGDRLLVVGENCAATGVLVLACSRIDAWFCVVNARLSAREIDGIAEHSGARRVLYTSAVSADAARHAQRHGGQQVHWAGTGTLHLGPLNGRTLPEACSAPGDQQVAGLIYTSGTSGAPKGVMLTHANIAFAAQAAQALRGMEPGQVVYGALPMAHVVGLSTQLMGALANGACVAIEPRFSPAALSAALEGGVTSFTGVPAMYARFLEWLRAEGRTVRAPALEVLGVAGSPLTPALKDEVEKAFGLPLLNGYGLTESSPTVAQVRKGAARTDCAVGLPIPGIQVRIVAAAGADAAPGSVGELWVRGPNVMKGYYRNEPLTREVIDAQGWFNTGDMARQGEDGALHIVGRSKELIIRSGFNVYPVEVEQAINSYPGIVQSAVVGRTVGHNEEVVAFVEVAGGHALDEAALRSYLRDQLSPYKQPSEIRVMAQLPAAPTGKVLKGVLKTLAGQPAHSIDN